MFGERINRRTFLGRAGTALAYLSVVGGGVSLRLQGASAEPLTSLSPDEARTMLAMARQLFPHDRLGDQYYWAAVGGIDVEMAASSDLARRIKEGLARLDQVVGVRFTELSAGNQLHAMKTLEGSPFFTDVLGKTNYYFYNNKRVWPQFGYEGSSFEFGGYLHRGFDDVGWLKAS